MDSMEYRIRRAGKAYLANMWKEALLNSGKSVVVINPDGATRQRRKKHLTLIEPLPKKDSTMVIYDDL